MSNEMQIFNPAADMETSGQAAFMSFACTTQEEKIKAYNAMNTTDTRLKECINMEIPLVDVMIVSAQVTNKESGEVQDVPRIILFDANGNTYGATSWGVYYAISRVMQVFGTLHFDEPITVIPYEVQTKNGFTLSLRIK